MSDDEGGHLYVYEDSEFLLIVIVEGNLHGGTVTPRFFVQFSPAFRTELTNGARLAEQEK